MTTLTTQQQDEQIAAARHALAATTKMLHNGEVDDTIIVMATLQVAAGMTAHFYMAGADEAMVKAFTMWLQEAREYEEQSRERREATTH